MSMKQGVAARNEMTPIPNARNQRVTSVSVFAETVFFKTQKSYCLHFSHLQRHSLLETIIIITIIT